MNLFNHVMNIKNSYPTIAVALGTFDGLHIGHQQVIGGAVDWAKKNNGVSAVFTFSNHPLSVVSPEICPPLIYSNEVKSRLLAQMGVDILFNIPFTSELLQLSPEMFIDMLYTNIKPKQIIVGPNYSFGYKGKGTPEMLQLAGKHLGFGVEVYPAVTTNGLIVSSTAIRNHLAAGNIEEASALLGRQYTLYNMTVISGQKRGRQLGYPTANLALPPGMIIPPDGVYAVRLRYGSQLYTGVANIGSNPTFMDHSRRIEVHILNFSQDIYQQTLDIIFFKRLRPETRFSSPELLKQQIALDIEQTVHYFASLAENQALF